MQRVNSGNTRLTKRCSSPLTCGRRTVTVPVLKVNLCGLPDALR